MERVVESESKTTEVEIEFEEEEELEFIVPWADEEYGDSSGNRRLYGATFGGLIAILTLLIVPLVTLPGMVILVLFAEIYLIDWTYSKIKLLRSVESNLRAGIAGRQDCSSKIDQKNPMTHPKEQFTM